MAATTRIRLCSALTVETARREPERARLGTRKARTLLALLAAERGGWSRSTASSTVLWPSVRPADPAANVATLVSRTRRLLGAEVISATGRPTGSSPATGRPSTSTRRPRWSTRPTAPLAAGEYGARRSRVPAGARPAGHPPGAPGRARRRLGRAVRAEVDELRAGPGTSWRGADVVEPAEAVAVAPRRSRPTRTTSARSGT